jgi:hypothetical protein
MQLNFTDVLSEEIDGSSVDVRGGWLTQKVFYIMSTRRNRDFRKIDFFEPS